MRLRLFGREKRLGFTDIYLAGLIVVAGVALAAYVGAVGVEVNRVRIPDVRNPPIYPGAEDVKVEGNVLVGVAHDDPIPEEGWGRVITFRTRDKVEDVLAYYEKALQEEGWELGIGDEQQRSFYYYSGPKRSRHTSYLVVTAEEMEGEGTRVRLVVRL